MTSNCGNIPHTNTNTVLFPKVLKQTKFTNQGFTVSPVLKSFYFMYFLCSLYHSQILLYRKQYTNKDIDDFKKYRYI